MGPGGGAKRLETMGRGSDVQVGTMFITNNTVHIVYIYSIIRVYSVYSLYSVYSVYSV
jgi:hypothetical protein